MSAPYRPDPARRQFVLGGALLAASGAAYAALPRRRADLLAEGELEKAIPRRIGAYTYADNDGLVLPPADELTLKVYDQVLSRVYAGPDNAAVMLLIAYGGGQSGLFQIHRPEVCYPNSGYVLSGRAVVPVEVGPGRSVDGTFYTATGGRTEQLLYWTRIDDAFPLSSMAERMAVLRSNLHGRLPDGILVRMSVVDNDAPGSLRLLEGFARDLVRAVGSIGRQAMLGRTA